MVGSGKSEPYKETFSIDLDRGVFCFNSEQCSQVFDIDKVSDARLAFSDTPDHLMIVSRVTGKFEQVIRDRKPVSAVDASCSVTAFTPIPGRKF